ncbi:MAG: NADH-quinone oxidoreductase subunit J [Coriobacteriia bacterium]|nr:NADH-quinone oxidoreductase subunit J [Coriobacteriia bacterium]MBN2822424.1 NADH-quinone oxidoreductase subunit J [Coriobacteriia bacterium]
MSETVSPVMFLILAFATIGGAVMMLSTRNVVHAAFWLLEIMVATAGLYLLLSAEFLALVQVLVYAGAVSVLVLFVIMLTLRRREDAIRPYEPSWAGTIIAALFLGALYMAITRFVPVIAEMPEKVPGVADFGREMFTTWMLPFEVASLVLLAALVGAVWWSKGGDGR